MVVQPTQAHNLGKYDNNGKDGYFRFDDDHKTSNKYILSITQIWMDQFQFNTYSNVAKKIRDKTENLPKSPFHA